MIKIKGQTFNSRDFNLNHSSESDDYIKNDKKVASDNIQVRPLSISATIFYKVKSEIEDSNEKKVFLEDILYNQSLITVVDVDNYREFNNLYLRKFNITKQYKEGFLGEVEFGYIPITETALEGKKVYKGYSNRSINSVERPLKKITLNEIETPSITKKALESIGVKSIDGKYNFKALDLSFDSVASSKKIMSSIGDFKANFELSPSGVLDVFDDVGNSLSMGQKLITNAELLANTIPGVNISLKILPLTQKASQGVFDISSLGKDFILAANEVKSSFIEFGESFD